MWDRLARRVVVVVCLLSGCGGGGGQPDSGAIEIDAAVPPDADTTLRISPAAPVMSVNNGIAPVLWLHAYVGDTEVVATWSLDATDRATIDNGGIMTASGSSGGLVAAHASYEGMTADATVTIRLSRRDDRVGLSMDQMNALRDATTPDGSTDWRYPYDGTVFPRGLRAPQLMWNGSSAGDVFRIAYNTEYASVEVFTTADPPSRFELDRAWWNELVDSGDGGDLALAVARDPATPGVVAAQTWTIAPTALPGTIYVGDHLMTGQLRIDPGSDAVPALPNADATCRECHTVSHDGNRMVIGGDAIESVWDMDSQTSLLNLGSVGKAVRNWAMVGLSPDGQFVIENNANIPGPPGGSDGIWVAATGVKLTGTGLDGILLDFPAFSPDGTVFAYVDHASGELGLRDFDATGPTVSNPRVLATPGADALGWASVAPNSDWVTYSRASSLDSRFGATGQIYLATDAASSDTALAAANDDDRVMDFFPCFAPVEAGGYLWVAFISRRTYGNVLTGTPDTVKQVWITALDPDATPGTDPSHPAFWMPGQPTAGLLFRPQWVAAP